MTIRYSYKVLSGLLLLSFFIQRSHAAPCEVSFSPTAPDYYHLSCNETVVTLNDSAIGSSTAPAYGIVDTGSTPASSAQSLFTLRSLKPGSVLNVQGGSFWGQRNPSSGAFYGLYNWSQANNAVVQTLFNNANMDVQGTGAVYGILTEAFSATGQANVILSGSGHINVTNLESNDNNVNAFRGIRVNGYGSSLIQLTADTDYSLNITRGLGLALQSERYNELAIDNSAKLAVTTSGDTGHAIWAKMADSTASSGTTIINTSANTVLNTTGNTAHGIFVEFTGSRPNSVNTINILNQGTITTSGQAFSTNPAASGIVTTGNIHQVQIVNAGNITTSNNHQAYGISSQGIGTANIQNTGNISAGVGVYLKDFTSGSFSNSGRLSATGTDRYALKLASNTIATTLLGGSQIDGHLYSAGTGNTVAMLGSGWMNGDFISGSAANNFTLLDVKTDGAQSSNWTLNGGLNPLAGISAIQINNGINGTTATLNLLPSLAGDYSLQNQLFSGDGLLRVGLVNGNNQFNLSHQTFSGFSGTLALANSWFDLNQLNLSSTPILPSNMTLRLENGNTTTALGEVDLGSHLENAGAQIHLLLNGQPGGTTLKANSYTNNGGSLSLNTVLGGDGSPSDKLVTNQVINGGAPTVIQVNNLGGTGGITYDHGILLVEVLTPGQSAANAFTLSAPLYAGAFEYDLRQEDGQNWYLSNNFNSSDRDFISYRPRVGMLGSLSGQLRLADLNMLGDLHKRIGDTPQGTWARLLSGKLDIDRTGSKGADNSSEGHYYGFQAGHDLWQLPAQNATWRIGGLVGLLEDRSIVKGYSRDVWGRLGQSDIHSRYFGTYATYRHNRHFYLDNVLQLAHHKYNLRPDRAEDNDGTAKSLQASVEMGLALQLGPKSQWQLEPQAQLIYQIIDIKEIGLDNGTTRAKQDTSKGWSVRLGSRLKTTRTTHWGQWQPYGRFNLIYSNMGTDRNRFSSTGGDETIIQRNTNYASSELALGSTLSLSPKVSLYGELGRTFHLSGDTKLTNPLQGTFGIRGSW